MKACSFHSGEEKKRNKRWGQGPLIITLSPALQSWIELQSTLENPAVMKERLSLLQACKFSLFNQVLICQNVIIASLWHDIYLRTSGISIWHCTKLRCLLVLPTCLDGLEMCCSISLHFHLFMRMYSSFYESFVKRIFTLCSF